MGDITYFLRSVSLLLSRSCSYFMQEEVRCIDLTVHGTIGSESGSAMARTVGLPIAMSARLLLSGMYVRKVA